ncbi:uncharacterized protein PHACADRAFT_261102 [Phanerochaete carnosa HHB-10118-sp]|uniref:NADAR domain-containing protein n=1 Tax=Phanerochaete carnosa (strain HHB-10118-sp) TaxID=650164 RepID=K5WQF4_PHACS|nr:uncharacterized protein PHACADRAFT_261102 [Phanerochaete carnosa HHB-10118-sp]EKM52582.1 hypothetical protein PHACADRAFT_261102 [Phanerochaete carnosa HHB-10118-sp]
MPEQQDNDNMDVDEPSENHEESRDAPVTGLPILFYNRDEPYYEFANFAPHSVRFERKEYPTAEHLFQAHKFLSTRPDLAERIRKVPTPRAALEEATRLRKLQRSDWFDVNISIMDQILEAKFTQDARLEKLLLDTGDSEIIENSPVDPFWGCGADGQGKNELGKALMRLRERLRRQGRDSPSGQRRWSQMDHEAPGSQNTTYVKHAKL